MYIITCPKCGNRIKFNDVLNKVFEYENDDGTCEDPFAGEMGFLINFPCNNEECTARWSLQLERTDIDDEFEADGKHIKPRKKKHIDNPGHIKFVK